MKTAIERAIDAAGGQGALAKRMGVSYQAVQKWSTKGVPAKRVLQIEQLTGISRHDLRPDIYPRDPRRTSELRV